MKKTETTTLLTYYIKCWIITRMISGMIDMKDNCRSWGPFPALSVYLICLNDSFLQRLGIQNIFAHNQPQINVQYLCILMLFMSFVLWEQKVFFFLHFLRSHYIYIYTHIILVFHVVNVLFYQWKVIMILCHRAQGSGWMNWPVCHSEGIPCTHFAETARQWLVYDWCVFLGKGPWNSSGFIGFIVHTDFVFVVGEGVDSILKQWPTTLSKRNIWTLNIQSISLLRGSKKLAPNQVLNSPADPRVGCNGRFVGALYSLFLGNVPPGINAIIKQFRWRWKTGWMIGHLYRTVIIDVYLFSTLRFCWFVSVWIVPVTRRGGCMFGSSFSTGCFLHQDNHPSSATWKTSYQRCFQVLYHKLWHRMKDFHDNKMLKVPGNIYLMLALSRLFLKHDRSHISWCPFPFQVFHVWLCDIYRKLCGN